MSELYFHQLRTRDVGPFNAEQIRQRIRAGQIQASDTLRASGETRGYAAGEYYAFQDEIAKVVTKETHGRRWICRRARGSDGRSTSAMCGPYTRAEIVDLLMRSELSPSDYVWREGFTAWQRLDSVAQLRLPIPNFPRLPIAWRSVEGLDWEGETVRPRMEPVGIPREAVSERTLTVAFTLVCALLGVIALRLMAPHFHGLSRRSLAHATARTSALAPTHLSLNAKTIPGFQPKIEIHSDAALNSPLLLQVWGRAGALPGHRTYYRALRLLSRGKLQLPVQLPNLGMPPGQYFLRLQSGSQQRDAKVTVAPRPRPVRRFY